MLEVYMIWDGLFISHYTNNSFILHCCSMYISVASSPLSVFILFCHLTVYMFRSQPAFCVSLNMKNLYMHLHWSQHYKATDYIMMFALNCMITASDLLFCYGSHFTDASCTSEGVGTVRHPLSVLYLPPAFFLDQRYLLHRSFSYFGASCPGKVRNGTKTSPRSVTYYDSIVKTIL